MKVASWVFLGPHSCLLPLHCTLEYFRISLSILFVFIIVLFSLLVKSLPHLNSITRSSDMLHTYQYTPEDDFFCFWDM